MGTRLRNPDTQTRPEHKLPAVEDQLERTLAQRAALARELGDPAAIHDERDALTSVIDTLARQHPELRNELADREVERRPEWARDALGERPDRTHDAARWDHAARALAQYRIEYDISADGELGREAPAHHLDVGR